MLGQNELLVPLNGDERNERAVDIAAAIARRNGRTVHLVSFVDAQDLVDRQRDYLARVGERFEDIQIEQSVIIAEDMPTAMADCCGPQSLPVMASSGRVFLHDGYIGSAAETVVRLSGRPAMIVGKHCDTAAGLDVSRVIVPLDGHLTAEAAVPIGRRWAQELDVPLWLMSVVVPSRKSRPSAEREPTTDRRLLESNYLRRAAARLDDPDVPLEWEILHSSDPADALIDEGGDDSLIVMTTHGRTGLGRLAMGSVAAKIVRHAHRPVVVFRPDVQPDGQPEDGTTVRQDA